MCGAIGKKDACKILDVPPNSSKARIRQAYLEKMKLYHPDVSMDVNANETAVRLNAAYEELVQVLFPYLQHPYRKRILC